VLDFFHLGDTPLGRQVRAAAPARRGAAI